MKKIVITGLICACWYFPSAVLAQSYSSNQTSANDKTKHAAPVQAKKSKEVAKDDAKEDDAKDDDTKDKDAKEEDKHLTSTLTFLSNYMFRGISQTANNPAVQGEMNYDIKWGFYLNGWASNVKFDDTSASIEIDTTAGWEHTFFDALGVDLSVVRYNYPKANDLAYVEGLLELTYKFLIAGVGYSNNVFNSHESGTYYHAGIKYDIPAKYIKIEDVSITGNFGHYSLPYRAGFSYNDYGVGISKDIDAYTLSLLWTDTNRQAQLAPYDGSTFIASVAVSL